MAESEQESLAADLWSAIVFSPDTSWHYLGNRFLRKSTSPVDPAVHVFVSSWTNDKRRIRPAEHLRASFPHRIEIPDAFDPWLPIKQEDLPSWLARLIIFGAAVHARGGELADVEDLLPALRTAVTHAGPQVIADELTRGGFTKEQAQCADRRLETALDLFPRTGCTVDPKDRAKWPDDVATERLLPIPSPGHYYAFQQSLADANKHYDLVDGAMFPRASLTRAGVKGYAEKRPHNIPPGDDLLLNPAELEDLQQLMLTQLEELSDLDADILDALMSAWINRSRSPSDMVTVHIADLLEMRGLKRKKAGHGRRGGYEPEQTADLWRCIFRLRDFWIDLGDVTVTETNPAGRRKRERKAIASPALILEALLGQRRLDGKVEADSFMARPGAVFARFLFGPGRQAALLSSHALRYHPLRQRIEKRITRLLAWHWRAGAKQGDFVRTYRVQTLVDETGLEIDQRNPTRTRARLEKALDQLHRDEVISAWQYGSGWREERLPQRGWFPLWLDARLEIEAPDVIKDAYRGITAYHATRRKALSSDNPWGDRLKAQRQTLRISQMETAEQLGISRAYVAQIEAGRKPSRRVQKKLEDWIRGLSPGAETGTGQDPQA